MSNYHVATIGYADGRQKAYLLDSRLSVAADAGRILRLEDVVPAMRFANQLVRRLPASDKTARDWKSLLGTVGKAALPLLGAIAAPEGALIGAALGGLGGVVGKTAPPQCQCPPTAAGLSFPRGDTRHIAFYKPSKEVLKIRIKRLRKEKKEGEAKAAELEKVKAELETKVGEAEAATAEQQRQEELAAARAEGATYVPPAAATVIDPITREMAGITLGESEDPFEPNENELEELEYAGDLIRGGDAERAIDVLDASGWMDRVLPAMLDATRGITPIRTRRADRVCDGGPGCVACQRDEEWHGRLPQGEFYKSSLVRATLTRDLDDGVYGMVDLGKPFPLPISISTNHGPARAKVSSAHELAHVANQLFKLGLSHPQVHELGVFYATEGVPMLNALANATGGAA